MRFAILALSLLLGLAPLAGIGWILATGMITPWPPSATVDGLFMTLILLTLSLCFLLNAYWEARDHGLVKFMQKEKPAAPTKTAAAPAKASAAGAAPKTTPPPTSSASSSAPAAKVSS
jgi:hypothetical protein